jgi:enoyl-CoA hydratase
MVEASNTKGTQKDGILATLEWQDEVAVVTIRRPQRRNAVNHPTLLLLKQFQEEARGRARVLVLTGEGEGFCAGADLTGVEDEEFGSALFATLLGFTLLPCITLAAVHGYALGAGTQLAVACDLRVATPSSVFGIPAAKLGLAVDQWTIERVAGECGGAIARNMLLGASTYSGEQLYTQGAVHKLGMLSDALEWARYLATLAPITIAAHKRGLEAAAEKIVNDAAFEALRAQAWASADAHEGRTAFLEKRKARFNGT